MPQRHLSKYDRSYPRFNPQQKSKFLWWKMKRGRTEQRIESWTRPKRISYGHLFADCFSTLNYQNIKWSYFVGFWQAWLGGPGWDKCSRGRGFETQHRMLPHGQFFPIFFVKIVLKDQNYIMKRPEFDVINKFWHSYAEAMHSDWLKEVTWWPF